MQIKQYHRITLLAIAVLLTALAISLGMRSGLSLQGEEEERQSNRLVREKSPYLLQHAYNPVDWFPWGEEAFEKARSENKPIFLSVGYSTCHWCHVMERESFSSAEIAAVMNEHFVCIKVDREERPDIDAVYMAFVQAATGHGGWPMSVFLTPDLKPFFGGTYFPPESRGGITGFRPLLLKIAEQWDENREAILNSAGRITRQLREFNEGTDSADLKIGQDLLDRTHGWYKSNFDAQEGGFGEPPKFPRPVNFSFLLRYQARAEQKEEILKMVALSLRKMSRGGIHDHLGGGFHRYSTDRRWFLPHFEKMLYDQAQLAISYVETHQITGDPLLAEVARGIFEYVLRDMTGTEGGFYSAEDADSPVSHKNLEEHAEGAFYVWTHQEIADHLGENAAIFNHYYGVKQNGNVALDRFGEFENKNILHVAATLEQTARKFGKSPQHIQAAIESGRKRLFEVRSTRPRPGLDDKVLTAWNGLMISALSRGYQVLREPRYLRAAEKAAAFISGKLYDEGTHHLKRRYREGEAAIEGLADDYTFFIQGLLDLYESSLDGRWLLLAMDLMETQVGLFWDSDKGAFYNTTGKDPSVLMRIKEAYDGAEPAPNSVAVLNLLRLSEMAAEEKWRQMAEKSIQAFSQRLDTAPHAMPQMMVALDFYLQKPKQILIAGDKDWPDTQAILREVHRRFIPGRIILLADESRTQKRLAKTLEILDSLQRIDGKATAYICENYVCKLPTNEVAVVARLLDGG